MQIAKLCFAVLILKNWKKYNLSLIERCDKKYLNYISAIIFRLSRPRNVKFEILLVDKKKTSWHFRSWSRENASLEDLHVLQRKLIISPALSVFGRFWEADCGFTEQHQILLRILKTWPFFILARGFFYMKKFNKKKRLNKLWKGVKLDRFPRKR